MDNNIIDKRTKMGKVKEDLLGRKFTYLTVTGRRIDKLSYIWVCTCVCNKEVYCQSAQLLNGLRKSCGCKRKEMALAKNLKHGLSKTSEYSAWANIKSRCYDKNDKNYADYGGRGIKMSDRWINSFENFLADMGNKPTHKHTIDRYPNNDGNYELANCRWATMKQQLANQRRRRPRKKYLQIKSEHAEFLKALKEIAVGYERSTVIDDNTLCKYLINTAKEAIKKHSPIN